MSILIQSNLYLKTLEIKNNKIIYTEVFIKGSS